MKTMKGRSGQVMLYLMQKNQETWGGIWSRELTHNKRAEWLENVEKEVERVGKQREIVTTIGCVTKQLRKLPNWKAPHLDGLHGYWLKYMTTLWGEIAT